MIGQGGQVCGLSTDQKSVMKKGGCGMGYLMDISRGESRVVCFSWHLIRGRVMIRKAINGHSRVQRLFRYTKT
jgi:hypothetical protein